MSELLPPPEPPTIHEVRVLYFAIESSGRRFSVTREALEHYAERWTREGLRFETVATSESFPIFGELRLESFP